MSDILGFEIGGFTLNVLLNAVIVAAVCLIVIKIILSFVDRAFAKTGLDSTLKKLARLALKIGLLFVGVVIVMGCLDIPVTSLVAVLSVVGLAISLAVQNFLSNVAGGLQLIASKPFQIGDFVEIGGCVGTVVDIGLFYSKINTIDNKLIQMPNSSIVSSNIINYSTEANRMVEIKVCASYDTPVEKVRETLAELASGHPLTLDSPEPMIHVSGYGESTIEYLVRVWCANGDYWTVYFDLMDRIKPTFDKAGVAMSYPHVNVHMADK